MNEIFADTSGWASAFVRTETYHAVAAAYLRQWQADGTQVITTNYIVNEVSALLTSPLSVPRPQQIGILDAIRRAACVTVVHIDPDLDAAAYVLFQNWPDKLWIQWDRMEEGIATELVALGVPKEHIVLGFRPEAMRRGTEFAVA